MLGFRIGESNWSECRVRSYRGWGWREVQVRFQGLVFLLFLFLTSRFLSEAPGFPPVSFPVALVLNPSFLVLLLISSRRN